MEVACNQILGGQRGKKYNDLPGGQIDDLLSGKHCPFPFLPATPLSLSWNIEGLFEKTGSPWLASSAASGTTDIRGRTPSGVPCWEVAAQCQEQLSQTKIVSLLKIHLFLSFRKTGGGAFSDPLLYSWRGCLLSGPQWIPLKPCQITVTKTSVISDERTRLIPPFRCAISKS